MKTLTTIFLALVLMFTSATVLTVQMPLKAASQPESGDKRFGNVHVYVTTGAEDKVEVENYDKNVSFIKAEDGILKIASYGQKELAVLVIVKSLVSIDADREAIIQSLTDLGINSKDITLSDDAIALMKSGDELHSFQKKIRKANDKGRAVQIRDAGSVSASLDKYTVAWNA